MKATVSMFLSSKFVFSAIARPVGFEANYYRLHIQQWETMVNPVGAAAVGWLVNV